MEGLLNWIDRFRTPITVIIVAAIIAGSGVLAFRSLQLRTLVSQVSADTTSSQEIESLKNTQAQLEQQLTSLKAQADALPATQETSSTTATSVDNSATQQSQGGLVHLNSADEAALDTLPGIGPSKAQAILDYRNAHGPFKSLDDLTNVKGIGDSTLAKIKPQLTLD